MSLHLSGKLCAVGFVLATLVTAFSAPPKTEKTVTLDLTPQVTLLATARTAAAPTPVGPVATPVFTLKATAYNSHASQTDDTPNITATGAQTRFGIIAVSRDLLDEEIPYGSLVRIKDLGGYYNGRGAGRFQSLLDEQLFIVEDTMHQRKRDQVDVWFPRLADAVNWGVRQVEVEVVRWGRAGAELYASESDFTTPPRLSAVQ